MGVVLILGIESDTDDRSEAVYFSPVGWHCQ